MPRAPCCEKMGLKKGPWTREEDQLLISYVQNYGHTNWRALPKHAGLLRCGKSCRLRWINYLRPDIKRGNFSPQEEETIINFHQLLGNRWSAIAARLPGRTDNEIKNVWHTHLKKKLHKNQKQTTPEVDTTAPICVPICSDNIGSSSNATNTTQSSAEYSSSSEYSSSLQATSFSSEATTDNICVAKDESTGVLGYFPEIDDSFWVDALSDHSVEIDQVGLFEDDGMDFWYNVFASSEDLQLPEC